MEESRLTNVVAVHKESTEAFVYPPKDKEEEYMAQGVYINGFENDQQDG